MHFDISFQTSFFSFYFQWLQKMDIYSFYILHSLFYLYDCYSSVTKVNFEGMNLRIKAPTMKATPNFLCNI